MTNTTVDTDIVNEVGVALLKEGTSGPRLPSSIRSRYMAGVVFLGAATIGTLGVVQPAEAMALRVAVYDTHTLPAGSMQQSSSPRIVDAPSVLRRIRRQAEFSWGQIASILGVSRRTIHNWLNGAQIAEVHRLNLGQLSAVIDSHDSGIPELTRQTLTDIPESGRSVLDNLAASFQGSRRRMSTLSVGDMLGPVEDSGPASSAGAETGRRSSLRGGPIARRSQGNG